MRGWNYACGKASYSRLVISASSAPQGRGGTTPARRLRILDRDNDHSFVAIRPGAMPAKGLRTFDDASLAAANIGRVELCLREGLVFPTSGTSSPCLRKGVPDVGNTK